jgi:hypothetical protein
MVAAAADDDNSSRAGSAGRFATAATATAKGRDAPIAEKARIRKTIAQRSGCAIAGGRWRSRTTAASDTDADADADAATTTTATYKIRHQRVCRQSSHPPCCCRRCHRRQRRDSAIR